MQQLYLTNTGKTSVISAVGAFIAVTTLFLMATTAYMSWRVYKMKKYRVKTSKSKIDQKMGQADSVKLPDKEKKWVKEEEAKSNKHAQKKKGSDG